MGSSKKLRQSVLQWMQDSPQGGHLGRDATLKRIKQLFYRRGMRDEISNIILGVVMCANVVRMIVLYLQPLPIPVAPWVDISMDFIEGLPMSFGKKVIFVVVDRLTKYAHLIPLKHPYAALTVAKHFMDEVYRLHGLPEKIVSDRDATFFSDFWKSIFNSMGVDLLFSSAYHPQTDGQTEVVNRCLKTYLRCMTSDNPCSWSLWLSLAEWWYNTNHHTAIGKSPFEALYGYEQPLHLPYIPGESKKRCCQ